MKPCAILQKPKNMDCNTQNMIKYIMHTGVGIESFRREFLIDLSIFM